MLAKSKLSQLCHTRLGRFYTSKNLVCEASEVRKEEGGMGNSLELSHSTAPPLSAPAGVNFWRHLADNECSLFSFSQSRLSSAP